VILLNIDLWCPGSRAAFFASLTWAGGPYFAALTGLLRRNSSACSTLIPGTLR
jgi:hypothetical protein